MYSQLSAPDPFSEKRKVKLGIDVNVGANEFQVKLDQTLQFDKTTVFNAYGQGSVIKINNQEFDAEKVCLGKSQVCLGYVIDKFMDY